MTTATFRVALLAVPSTSRCSHTAAFSVRWTWPYTKLWIPLLFGVSAALPNILMGLTSWDRTISSLLPLGHY